MKTSRPWKLLVIFSFVTMGFIFLNEYSVVTKTDLSSTQSELTPVELRGKNLVGYQAWFETQARDGQWRHWVLNNIVSKENIRVDMWPETAEYPSSSLQSTPFFLGNGQPAQLFSSSHPGVIDLHMSWMKKYNIDGAILQWFLADDRDPDLRQKRFEILDQVKVNAEKYDRDFSVMFDISGAQDNALCYPNQVITAGAFDLNLCLASRWMDIVNKGITSSPKYQKINGKPLLAIWGIGYRHNSFLTAEKALSFLRWVSSEAPPQYRATLLGGVSPSWRTLKGDALEDPAWINVYKAFHIISPWMVGSYQNQADAVNYIRTQAVQDANYLSATGQYYLPVIFPGFSWSNMARYEPSKNGTPNLIPRMGGRFMWAQAYEFSKLGVRSLYTAMFDEVDEGTAIFKTAPTAPQAPREFYSVTLDKDGQNLPSDFYLQVSQKISEALKTNIFSATLPFINTDVDALVVPGNSSLRSNESVQIPAGRISYQMDGNLVIYSANNQILWATNTNRNCGASCVAIFQNDGNIVLKDGNDIYWASYTGGHPGALLIVSKGAPYLKIVSASGQILWSSN